MESKKNINNLMNNKNGFLITCVCSIVLLLTLCYFGINSSFKGTSAYEASCLGATPNPVVDGDSGKVYCCPNGYGKVGVVETPQGDEVYCYNLSDSGYVKYDSNLGKVLCHDYVQQDYWNSSSELSGDKICESNLGSAWSVLGDDESKVCNVTAVPLGKYHKGCTCSAEKSQCAVKANVQGVSGVASCYTARSVNDDADYYYWGDYSKEEGYTNVSTYTSELSCLSQNIPIIVVARNNGEEDEKHFTYNASVPLAFTSTPEKKIVVTFDSNKNSGLKINDNGILHEYFPKFVGWKLVFKRGNVSFAESKEAAFSGSWKSIANGDVTTDMSFRYLNVWPGGVTHLVSQWETLQIQLPTVESTNGDMCSWNTISGGTGESYESGGKYTTTSETPTELTLYAICEPEDSGDENTTTCPAGQYYYGQGECNVCPENYYCPERTYVGEDDPYAGTSGWMACPAGTSSPKGSDNIDDCVAQNSNFNSASVKITGTNKVGEKLTATVTTDPTGAKCTYQWYYGTSSSMTATSGSTAISGATSNTYFITDNMVDKYIYVIATCVKDGYNEKKVSDITDTVVAAKVVTGGTCSGSVEYNYTGWDKNGDGLWTVEGNNNECNDATVSGKLSVWNSNDRCCLIRDRYSINYNYNGGKKGGDDPNFGIVDGQITTELGYYGYDYVSINYPSKKVIITGNQNNTGADVGAATSANQTFAGWTFNGNTSSAKYGTSSSSITTVWSSTSTKVKAKYFRNLTTTSGATVMMTAHWTPVSLYVPTLTSPSGYTCVWNTKSDGSGRTYTSGEQYTPTENSEANITLYARCAKNDIQEPTTKVATIPTAASYCQTLTYNKTTQTLTKAAGDGYTFANNTRVNAGSQKVRAVLMSGYQWSDGTTTYKEFSCSIAKANPTLSLAEYRVSLTEGGSSSVDYSYGGDGVVGCDSRNTSIAVCEEKNGKLVITAKAAGITEILLTATSGINYNSSSTNAVSVTVVEDTSDIPKEEILTATFNANGGVLSGGNNRFCKKTSSSCDVTDLPTATRDGYTFKGWGIGNTCNSGEKEKITLNKDTSYYACWVKVENTPSVDDDGNVEDNVQTGNVVIMLVLCLGLLAMGYAYYYFKSIKQN